MVAAASSACYYHLVMHACRAHPGQSRDRSTNRTTFMRAHCCSDFETPTVQIRAKGAPIAIRKVIRESDCSRRSLLSTGRPARGAAAGGPQGGHLLGTRRSRGRSMQTGLVCRADSSTTGFGPWLELAPARASIRSARCPARLRAEYECLSKKWHWLPQPRRTNVQYPTGRSCRRC